MLNGAAERDGGHALEVGLVLGDGPGDGLLVGHDGACGVTLVDVPAAMLEPTPVDAHARGDEVAGGCEEAVGLKPSGVRPEDHGLELVAQAPPIEALGRGGNAQHLGGVEPGKHLGPGAGDRMVGLVHDEQLEELGGDLVEAPHQGLDGGDLDAVRQVLAVAGGDDAMGHTDLGERA